MAQASGWIRVPVGRVYWSGRPTEGDGVGCDGLYVERVELLPWWRWPVGVLVRVMMARLRHER